MSASLVGSEMCIRDSAWRAAKRLLRAALAHQPERGERQSRLRPHGLRTCLLYTSDAADDM
eukprot:4626259-Alexandrium_andersonii.AAC.1